MILFSSFQSKVKKTAKKETAEIDDLRHKKILKSVYYFIEDVETMKETKFNIGYSLYKYKGIKSIIAFLIFLTCIVQKPSWCIQNPQRFNQQCQDNENQLDYQIVSPMYLTTQQNTYISTILMITLFSYLALKCVFCKVLKQMEVYQLIASIILISSFVVFSILGSLWFPSLYDLTIMIKIIFIICQFHYIIDQLDRFCQIFYNTLPAIGLVLIFVLFQGVVLFLIFFKTETSQDNIQTQYTYSFTTLSRSMMSAYNVQKGLVFPDIFFEFLDKNPLISIFFYFLNIIMCIVVMGQIVGSINAGFQDKQQENLDYMQTLYPKIVKYVKNINFKYMDTNKAIFLAKKFIYQNFLQDFQFHGDEDTKKIIYLQRFIRKSLDCKIKNKKIAKQKDQKFEKIFNTKRTMLLRYLLMVIYILHFIIPLLIQEVIYQEAIDQIFIFSNYISYLIIVYRFLGLYLLQYNKNKTMYTIDIITSFGQLITANLLMLQEDCIFTDDYMIKNNLYYVWGVFNYSKFIVLYLILQQHKHYRIIFDLTKDLFEIIWDLFAQLLIFIVLFSGIGYTLFSGTVNNIFNEQNKEILQQKMRIDEVSIYLNDFLGSLIFFAQSGFSQKYDAFKELLLSIYYIKQLNIIYYILIEIFYYFYEMAFGEFIFGELILIILEIKAFYTKIYAQKMQKDNEHHKQSYI